MPDVRPLKAKVQTATIRRVVVERVVEKMVARPTISLPLEPHEPILLSRAVSLRYSSLVEEQPTIIEDDREPNILGQPADAERPRRPATYATGVRVVVKPSAGNVIDEQPSDLVVSRGWTYKLPPRIRRSRTGKVRTRGYKPCLCGCGAPCVDFFAKGHYARWRTMLARFADGELLPHRILPANLFERLGPWVPTSEGGVRPTKTYKALRR